MLSVISLIIYASTLIGGIFFNTILYRKNTRFFDVVPLFILMAALEFPYLIAVYIDPEIIHPATFSVLRDFDLEFSRYVILKIIFAVAFIFTGLSIPKNQYPDRILMDVNPWKLCLIVTLVTLTLYLESIGGLVELVTSWSDKSNLIKGTAAYRIILSTYIFLMVGFYIRESSGQRINTNTKFKLVAIISMGFIILGLGGERKNSFLLIIFSLIAWSEYVYKLKIVTFFNSILLFIGLVLAAVVPNLRVEDGYILLLESPFQFILASFSNLGELFKRFSEIDSGLFISHKFSNINDSWFYSTIPSFFTGFIPTTMYPDKPPMDEGVYIYNLAQGIHVEIPTPFSNLIPVGWPLSRVTGPFLHLWYPGVAIHGVLIALLYTYAYNKYEKYKSVIFLYIYCSMQITYFGLTNAFVFQLLLIFPIIIPIAIMYRKNIVAF